jgi:predicted peptidase
MGGYGTWDVASQYPDRFAAIVPLCGGGQIWLAKPLAAVPIWAFHGAKDNRVPLWMSQQMVAAVTKCGGHAKLTVYPNGGHSIDDVTYRNPQLYEWLLTQRRSRPQQQRPAVPRKHTGE